MNIIYPFQHPDIFKEYGQKVGGGILLYGPPGCGKTYLARATAGECNAYFINIALHEILSMWIGESEKHIHDYFALARRHKPSILFIDELDAIGTSRKQEQSRHDRSLTNQLLSELDGFNSDNDEVLVVGATNTPWFLDSALRRPGRSDRVLFVPPPDLEARVTIFQLHLKNKPVDKIDYPALAKMTNQYSGADIMAVCRVAAEEALKLALKTGITQPVTMQYLQNAIKQVAPSTLDWLSTAKNYATYSNQSGLYDPILDYFNKK